MTSEVRGREEGLTALSTNLNPGPRSLTLNFQPDPTNDVTSESLLRRGLTASYAIQTNPKPIELTLRIE